VSDNLGRVGRRIEQRRAGLRREDFVLLHGRLLVAQTSVCATIRIVTIFQGLALCAILLPNANDWQQEKATLMLLGYARVSKSDDQETAPQIRALKEAGCKKVFEETASGGRWDRPELHRLLDQLRSGDTLVVWKLDRLSRSLKDLLTILERIDIAGARFRSLTEAIDTSGPAGRMLMQMLGSFAEFEREMIRERTRAGLREARAKGRVPGRKPKITAEQQKEIVDAVSSGRKTSAEIARLFKIHRATVSRMVSQARVGA
jgi:DNA invertase Pin-like site-specific DNA recombinase